MRTKLLHSAGERTYALVLDTGEDPMRELARFAALEGLQASRFTAIGAFSDATIGYFDAQRRDYDRIAVGEQVEVLSLLGDVALGDDGPVVHAHVVLGRRDGAAAGGHLLEAHVRPTLEVLLVESPAHLRRRWNPSAGVALIDLDA